MAVDEVISDSRGWTFPLSGIAVAQVALELNLLIRLADRTEIVIEGEFFVCRAGETLAVGDPGACAETTMPSLIGQTIREVTASRADVLEIKFVDGYNLEVAPNNDSETWRVHFVDGRTYWSLPHGGVGMFDDCD